MRFISGLWTLLKGAVAVIRTDFGGLTIPDIENRERLRVLPTVMIPPREEYFGTTDRERGIPCGHEPASGAVVVTVMGQEFTVVVPDWARCCGDCYEKWLESRATVCHVCGEPILPGMNVAEISPFAEPPFTHMRPMCCRYPSKYAGLWGPGRLISLHELHPGQVAPGTRTMADHAALKNPGQPWFEGWDDKLKPN